MTFKRFPCTPPAATAAIGREDRGQGRVGSMKELLRTNDPVLLSAIDAVLRSEGIRCVVLDTHTSILEGSIGAIPRRVVVDEADHSRARRILEDAEIIEPDRTAGRPSPSGSRWRR